VTILRIVSMFAPVSRNRGLSCASTILNICGI
jgi:hypothetical protein